MLGSEKAPEQLGGPRGVGTYPTASGLMTFRCLGSDVSVHPLPVILGTPSPPRVSWLQGVTSTSLPPSLPPPLPELEPDLILLQVYVSTCFVAKPRPGSGHSPPKACPHGAHRLQGKPTLGTDAKRKKGARRCHPRGS